MARNILIVILIAIGAYGLTHYLDYRAAPIINAPVETAVDMDPKNDRMPDFSFATLQGQIINTADLRGKIIILNFWASWCAPCIKEFPALLQLAAKHRKDAVLIALSSDYDEEAMQRFLDKMKKDDPAISADNVLIALDDQSKITAALFQTYRLPETIIIDREGKMRKKLIGADWDGESVSKLLGDF